jgi:hypothetical protein
MGKKHRRIPAPQGPALADPTPAATAAASSFSSAALATAALAAAEVAATASSFSSAMPAVAKVAAAMSSSSLAGVYPLAERVGNPLDPAASVEPKSPSAVLPEYHVGRYVQYRNRLDLFDVLTPPCGLLDALVMAPSSQLVARLSLGDMA